MIYLENNPLTNKGTFTIYKESLLLINKETGEKKKEISFIIHTAKFMDISRGRL